MDLLAIFGVGTNLMFSLGIIFIIVFTLFYLRQRLSDYDGKLSDMIQIISGLNNEIKNIKATINIIPPSGQQNDGESKKVELTANNYTSVGEEEQNFYVNHENNDEDSENDSEDSDENSDENSVEDSDEDSDEDDDDENNENNEDEDNEEDDNDENNVKEIVGLEEDLEKDVSNLLKKNETTRVVDLSEVIDETQEENNEEISEVKLDKMTISELRDYAVLKGVAIDPKIKKKSEIVELLQNYI